MQKCSEGIFDQYNFGDFTNVDISFSVQYLATKYDPEVAALYKEYLQSFQTTEDTDTSMAIPGLTRDASGLQDSTAVGSWGESYGKYNCYGYAIGTNQWMTPGSYSGSSYNVFSVSSVKDAVIDDFNTRGYWAESYYHKTLHFDLLGKGNLCPCGGWRLSFYEGWFSVLLGP